MCIMPVEIECGSAWANGIHIKIVGSDPDVLKTDIVITVLVESENLVNHLIVYY